MAGRPQAPPLSRTSTRDAGITRGTGYASPAVIVSPYARPGYLCTTTFDHTSVLKVIDEKWNLGLLTRRDAAAASPLEGLDLDAPPAAWGSWAARGR